MTYDQAQSPRLGQRTSVESTYVRMFLGEEIPEVSWHGQLIYRIETQGLQIYDDSIPGWLDITGGVFGLITFVGPPTPVSINIGDIWFNSDDGHHEYRAASVGADEIVDGEWESMRDGKMDQQQADLEALQGQSDDLSSDLESVSNATSTAQDSADVAGARVTMSDYEPSVNNAESRDEGSLWLTRTRNRSNLADNPSFEIDLTNWTRTQCTMVRTAAAGAIDGGWVAVVTNSASTTIAHVAEWSFTTRQACLEGASITASIYADLVTGSGPGLYLRLSWYDSGGSLLSTSSGDPLDLTSDWQRLSITDVVPAGAVSYYLGVRSPPANALDVWRIDGLLVEQSDQLGRYFDGNTYDASWDGLANNSSSTMAGDKITRAFELVSGDWIRKYYNPDTLIGLDTLPVSGTMVTTNTLPASANVTGSSVASEALTAGDLVNVWSDDGLFKVRKASAASGSNHPAHGYVLDTVGLGSTVQVYYDGVNAFLSDLSPGTQFLSTVAGKASSRAPSGSGALVQRVGFATDPATLTFAPHDPVMVI